MSSKSRKSSKPVGFILGWVRTPDHAKLISTLPGKETPPRQTFQPPPRVHLRVHPLAPPIQSTGTARGLIASHRMYHIAARFYLGKNSHVTTASTTKKKINRQIMGGVASLPPLGRMSFLTEMSLNSACASREPRSSRSRFQKSSGGGGESGDGCTGFI